MDSKLKSEKPKGQNITVVVRVRPRNDLEKNMNSPNVVEINPEKPEIILSGDHSVSGHWIQKRSFSFDRVFNDKSKQIEVYKSVVCPILEEVVQGYSCTIFAYGQTGTGKTYTMEGCRSSERFHYSWDQDPKSGIIPRSIHNLFEMLDRNQNFSEFSVRVSFMEIYNEELYDLLGPPFDAQKLRIYEDGARKGSVFIHGLEELIVHNKNEVYSILEKGSMRRQTAATILNAHSSRSHTVFSITVNMKENNIHGEDILKTGRLYLVDLAGSENIGRSGAVDRRAREAGTINQSLLTLGRVIFALVEKTKHIPYRESKLTRLLQDSLGGRTKTVIIATISPSAYNIEETLSTLDYAQRAKHIKNRPEVNQLNKKGLIKEYTETIEKLKKDLIATRDKNGIYISDDSFGNMQNTMASQKDIIIELEDQISAVREQLDRITNIFEENQMTLEGQKIEIQHAKRWLTWVRDELAVTKNRMRITTKQIHEKDVVNSELVQQQQKLYQEATDLGAFAQEELEHLRTLKRKVRVLREIGAGNQDSVCEFISMVNQCKDVNDKQKIEYKKECTDYLKNIQINMNEFLVQFNLKFTDVSHGFQKLHEIVDFLNQNSNNILQEMNQQYSISNSSQTFGTKIGDTLKYHRQYLDTKLMDFQSHISNAVTQIQENDHLKKIETVENNSTNNVGLVLKWKTEITDSVTNLIEKYFTNVYEETKSNACQTKSILGEFKSLCNLKDSKTLSILNELDQNSCAIKEAIGSNINCYQNEFEAFSTEIDRKFDEFSKEIECAQIKLNKTREILEDHNGKYEICLHNYFTKMTSNVTEHIEHQHNDLKHVQQVVEASKDYYHSYFGDNIEKINQLVTKLDSYFNEYCSKAEENRFKSVEMLNNIFNSYKTTISSRKFESKSAGDTPKIKNNSLPNSITVPKSIEDIVTNLRLVDTNSFTNTPTPSKH
ncbi:hypothetical protein MXB_557, partial [Myxobolus squamalis]